MGTEGFWNKFESHFPRYLDQIKNREEFPCSGDGGDLLRDLIAIHWIRSWAIISVRDSAKRTVLKKIHQKNITERRLMIADIIEKRTGRANPSLLEIEKESSRLLENANRELVPEYHSKKNRTYFEVARKRFDNLQLSIRYTNSGDLAIGDAPVITTIGGNPRAAGPHQNVGILKTDYVAMPLGPHALAVLSNRADYTDLTTIDVARHNELQWSTFVVWIAAMPDGLADQRLHREAETPSAPEV